MIRIGRFVNLSKNEISTLSHKSEALNIMIFIEILAATRSINVFCTSAGNVSDEIQHYNANHKFRIRIKTHKSFNNWEKGL